MIKRLWLVIISCAGIAGMLQAQELAFSGYYENQLFPQNLNGKFIFQDYNKIRLDLSSEIGENVNFQADYIYRIFHGATKFNAFDFIPESVVKDFAAQRHVPAENLRPLFDFEFADENFLDNAYVTVYLNKLTLRIGKQQLPWGSGYTWNPTDIFNEKNALDPTYEKVGVNAFQVEYPFSAEGGITAIIGVGENWRKTTKALKIKHHVAGFDYSVSFVEKEQQGIDLYRLGPFTERRRLVGADFSGQLFGLGVWGEGAYNFMTGAGDFGQYLFGADYTLKNGLYVIAEYYRNELGKSSKEDYGINDWMRLLSAQGENLGRDYLFFGERYPIAELWNWSTFMLFNFNDKSGLVFPWFDYILNDNTEVIFVGYLPFGKSRSEFGEFGAGGFARIRVYF